MPTNARESRQIGQGVAGGSIHLHSASTTREAIAVLQNRLQQGIPTDSYTYVKVLKRCLKQKNDLSAAKQLHDCIAKSGMEQDVYVANNLVRVYIRCWRFEDARQVFDNLQRKSVVSWNSLIGGYAQHGRAEEAPQLLDQMHRTGVQANEVTYLSILQTCASPMALTAVHAHIRRAGFESDVRVGTALLKAYTKCGSITEARQVFDKLTHHNVISWSVMIGAYAKNGDVREAYSLFRQMLQEGHVPDAVIYLSLLNQGEAAVALEWVQEVQSCSKRGICV